jgi:hypothetical protein
MEPEYSLPHSEKPATCPYPEPDRSSPCPHPISLRSTLILSSQLTVTYTYSSRSMHQMSYPFSIAQIVPKDLSGSEACV